MKKKIVLLSWHYYGSKRKAGFHFIAAALQEGGNDVTFVTIPISLLSFIRAETRTLEKGFKKNIFQTKVIGGVKSIVNLTPVQPTISRSSRIVELLSKIFFRLRLEARRAVAEADIIIFESTQAIRLFSKVRQLNHQARLIYRVSDDMERSGASIETLESERKALPYFDVVSTPTQIMYEKFKKLNPLNTRLQYHGIDKFLYDQAEESPYSAQVNHVFVGNSLLDEGFIKIAADLFPKHEFHIIGPFEHRVDAVNVIYHGYMPFKDTVPYIKFASTGLQTRRREHGIAETLADSLKVHQYSYCKLPIIAPSVIDARHRENFFYYDYEDKSSIERAISEALRFRRMEFLPSVQSWQELAQDLVGV